MLAYYTKEAENVYDLRLLYYSLVRTRLGLQSFDIGQRGEGSRRRPFLVRFWAVGKASEAVEAGVRLGSVRRNHVQRLNIVEDCSDIEHNS